VSHLFDAWRRCRRDFDVYREALLEQAERDCRGILLNGRGRAKGVDPLDLFMGNEATAQAYASTELKEWWLEHGRPTFEQFERGYYC
jgi:hypothetical protein